LVIEAINFYCYCKWRSKRSSQPGITFWCGVNLKLEMILPYKIIIFSNCCIYSIGEGKRCLLKKDLWML